MGIKKMKNSSDIYVVDNFEEAQQFRYEHNDEPVEVGTAVGYDIPIAGTPAIMQLVCFEDIYFQEDD